MLLQSVVVWVKLRGEDYIDIQILIPPVKNGVGLKRAAVAALFAEVDDRPLVQRAKLYLLHSAGHDLEPTAADESRATFFGPSLPVGRAMHNKFFILDATGNNEPVSGE